MQEVKHYLKQTRGDRQQLKLAFCIARGYITVKQLESRHLRFLLGDPSLGARAERDKGASGHLLDREEELTHGFPAVQTKLSFSPRR